MTNRVSLSLVISSIIVVASCTQSTAPLIDNPNGVFEGSLVMYDSTGGNPLNGRLSVTRGHSTDLSGGWSLENGRGGRLAGAISDSTLWINLNPDLIDANTYLFGTFDGKNINGRWILSGFAGPIDHGTFVATGD